MSSSCLVLLLHFLLLLEFSSLSHGASPSVYESFVKCLTTKSIPQSDISKIVYSANNPSFNPILQAYIRNRRFVNSSTTSKPVIIVTPTQESHVSGAVLCTKEANLQLKIRSGGHDYEGISYISNVPFIMLDMFNLRSISVNVTDETAWVEAGATLGELYYNIWTKSNVLGFPAGVCPTVGVGGHLSGGGYGNMLRKFGLSVDHVLDARLVDANGRILDRKAMGEDMFWAIKGGGGASFGVILAFRIQLVQVPQTVTYFRVERFIVQNATDAVVQWQNVASKIDNSLYMRLLIQPITVKDKNKAKGAKSSKTIRATFIALFLGDSSRLMSLVSKEFPALGLKKQDCLEMSWIDSVLQWANFDNTTKADVLLNRTGDPLNFLKRKSDYVQVPIPRDRLESISQKMISLGKVGLVFNPYGGRMAEIPEDKTPFPHRAGILFKIQYSVNWNDGGVAAEKDYLSQIRDLYSFMTPYVSKNPRQAYLNYRDLDIGTNDHVSHSLEEGRVYGTKYFKNNFDRLVKVKSIVDPRNFFRNEQSIPTQWKRRKMF
ncbi:berberine bridge enzyme-like 21 [Lycium barbarum]|uniref:berberine bridge enzyme-like 21 n=1 Tax=Lycium barbarum TaxID=112863 RepID=UPI00293F63F8|nr:berberine bridge enzyme-like 21 [Lycium barbarum]